jgi:hypothetical protein
MNCPGTIISSTVPDSFDSITQLFGFIDEENKGYEKILQRILEQIIWNTDC